ncbi:hypothetical protein [Candidatus Harpocratesius sp.]
MENSNNNDLPIQENSSDGEKKMNSFDKKEEKSKEPPKDPTNLNFQEILEKELGIIKVYDYAINNALDLIFQPKLIEKYEQELIIPLIGGETEPETADGGRLFLREEFERIQVGEKVKTIIKSAEEIAKKHGVKTHVNKQIGTFSIILMVISMALYFILGTIFGQESSKTWVIPIFLLMCIGPQFLRSWLTKRFEKFKNTYNSEIFEIQSENIQDVRIFIQDIIDDVRDRLISNNVALEKIQFVLFSDGYTNVSFVRNQGGTRGSPLRAVYQFEYPEGMGPATSHQYGISGIPEDDENDLFIFLKNAKFDEEGRLNEFKQVFPAKSDYRLPEALLNASEFSTVDQPDLVIPDFHTFDKIRCECDKSIQLKSMKSSQSTLHDNFEFYLLIGENCPKCKKNPYILLNSPGNESIPSGLKNIFGED